MITVINYRENSGEFGDFITLQVQGALTATRSKRGNVVIDAPKAWVASGLNAASAAALVGQVLPIAGSIVKAKCEPFEFNGITYTEKNTFVPATLSSKKKSAVAEEEYQPTA